MNNTANQFRYSTELTIDLFDSFDNFVYETHALLQSLETIYRKKPEMMFEIIELVIADCEKRERQLEKFNNRLNNERLELLEENETLESELPIASNGGKKVILI